MNTEPPEGDELQRMLVSMKHTVLERATDRPRRRRGRTGVVVGVVALLALGTATGAVALTLSQQDRPVAAPSQTEAPAPAPSATTPTSAPITATPTPRPTPTSDPSPTPVTSKRIPGLCSALVPDSDYQRFFGAARLETFVVTEDGTREADGNDRIQGLRDPSEALYCSWQNEGVLAQITIKVERVTPAGAASDQEHAVAGGGTCEEQFGGEVCRSQIRAGDGPVPVTTEFYRDDLAIRISQVDFPTNGLLPAVVGEVWGD